MDDTEMAHSNVSQFTGGCKQFEDEGCICKGKCRIYPCITEKAYCHSSGESTQETAMSQICLKRSFIFGGCACFCKPASYS